MRIACIGSREITDSQRDLFFKVGAWITSNDHYISSGNADGSDSAFAAGGNSVNPRNVIIYLPWATYNKAYLHKDNRILKEPDEDWFDKTAPFHAKWNELTQGVRRLMARNYGIVHRANKVIALLNHSKIGGGGTGQGVRIAQSLKIPVLDLNGKSFEEIINWVTL